MQLNSIFFISALSVGIALMSGCGGKKAQLEKAATCTFPDSPERVAPEWICDAPVEGWPVTAVGSAPNSAAGVDFMKDQAAAAARVRIAQQMQVHVSNMIKQYAETTGTGDRETVDQVRASVSKVITDQTIVGSKVIKSRVSGPNGYIYVLVGIDESNAAVQAQNSLRTSMRNDEALWQQFRAEQNFEELADEISKTRY